MANTNEPLDWTKIGATQSDNVVKIEKHENKESKTELPPSQEKEVESQKIKQKREVSDDKRHATWKEMEINLAKFSVDLAVLAQQFEEHLAVVEILSPELKMKIQFLLKGCLRKKRSIFNNDMWDIIHELEGIFQ